MNSYYFCRGEGDGRKKGTDSAQHPGEGKREGTVVGRIPSGKKKRRGKRTESAFLRSAQIKKRRRSS